ncbi:hypothetical protein C2E23DRAFT_886771 [Lenzites betulinus]|nr:hypothetical protein C2E23DRAFT_886771 [Lenzites betulinus]
MAPEVTSTAEPGGTYGAFYWITHSTSKGRATRVYNNAHAVASHVDRAQLTPHDAQQALVHPRRNSTHALTAPRRDPLHRRTSRIARRGPPTVPRSMPVDGSRTRDFAHTGRGVSGTACPCVATAIADAAAPRSV